MRQLPSIARLTPSIVLGTFMVATSFAIGQPITDFAPAGQTSAVVADGADANAEHEDRAREGLTPSSNTDVPPDVMAKIRKNLRDGQYHIREAVGGSGWESQSAESGVRAEFTPSRVRILPTLSRQNQTGEWAVELNVTHWGFEPQLFSTDGKWRCNSLR